MKNYFYLLFVLGLNLIYGQEYEADIFVNQKDTLPFRVLLPKNFNPQKFYPLVMFFMDPVSEEMITNCNYSTEVLCFNQRILELNILQL